MIKITQFLIDATHYNNLQFRLFKVFAFHMQVACSLFLPFYHCERLFCCHGLVDGVVCCLIQCCHHLRHCCRLCRWFRPKPFWWRKITTPSSATPVAKASARVSCSMTTSSTTTRPRGSTSPPPPPGRGRRRSALVSPRFICVLTKQTNRSWLWLVSLHVWLVCGLFSFFFFSFIILKFDLWCSLKEEEIYGP